MKFIPLTMFFLALSVFAAAQCPIDYTYDAAGNRIKRISPNCFGGGGDDRSQAVAPAETAVITVFPNPSNGEITLAGAEMKPNDQVRFFNTEGRVVQESTFGDGIFDTSAWATGIYWIQILGLEKPQTIRFLKIE
jgi:hypothetical protein